MHEIRLSFALSHLNADGPFDVLARAKQLEAMGRDVIHLELGESDSQTPEHIKRAGIEAIAHDRTRYVQAGGTMELRAAVAHAVASRRGMRAFTVEEVVIGPGLKSILWNVLTALLEPGDEIVFADPAYTSYKACVDYLQGVAVPIALDESRGYRFDPERLEAAISPKTKMLLLNSPHNPTGSILTRDDLEAIARIALRHDITVVSDEIYNRILYSGDFVSIASIDGMRERTIVLDGFSKTYAMTGWRLGYGIMPKHLAAAVSLLGQNMYSCTPPFIQDAGLAALSGPDDELQGMISRLRRNRDVMVAGLNSIDGVTCSVPDGAFYVFPNISGVTDDDRELAAWILEEAGVAALAGSSFGNAGRGHMRFSYATTQSAIEEAIERMRSALARFPSGRKRARDPESMGESRTQ